MATPASTHAAARTDASSAPIATTQYGRVAGRTNEGIHVFKGIPYGASTAGPGRFLPPSAPASWSGVREATSYPPMCPQGDPVRAGLFSSWIEGGQGMDEDCLALNIWTPGLRDGAKRPVMVWFHGGDFSSLSGSRNVFEGARLSRNGDVVVVTLNHRLNLFGFLHLAELLPDYPDAGNAGMLDLVAALRFVRDNIAEFGGDPGNVTIFGQSGGGGKVATMMAMPSGAGLFHRAIVQSGTYARSAHMQALTPEAATANVRILLTALGLGAGDAARLPTLPMTTLTAGLLKAAQGPERLIFRPVADGRALPSGPCWPEAPAVSANVPLMIGTTATEMTMLMGSRNEALFALDEDGLRKRLGHTLDADRIADTIATFREAQPDATPGELFFAISTANVFRRGAWTHADLKAAQKRAPVWLYEIDWVTPVDGGKWGSPHSMEHPLVFDNVAVSASMVGDGKAAQAMVAQINPTWIAFARNGDPNNAAIPHWPAWDPQTRPTMVFDTVSKVVNGFRDAERKVLDGQSTRGPLD